MSSASPPFPLCPSPSPLVVHFEVSLWQSFLLCANWLLALLQLRLQLQLGLRQGLLSVATCRAWPTTLPPFPLSPPFLSFSLVHVDSCRSLSPVLSVASLPILEAKRHSSAHKTITHHLTDALQNYRPQLPLMPPSLTPSLPSSRRSFLWACNCCSLARTVRSFIDCCILIIVTMLCVLSVRPSVLPCLVLLAP